MKTRVFLIAAIFAIAFSQNSFAQKFDPLSINEGPELKTDVVGSYPTEVWEYQWLVEYWKVFQKKYISYASFGEPTEITIVGDDGDSRSQYTYNSNQQLTQSLEQKKQGDDWINNRREVSEYDNDGNMSQVMVETWNGTSWDLAFGTQYIYEMEGEEVVSLITKIWSRDDDAWINSSRSTFSFSQDNSVVETVTEKWENGAWVNSIMMRMELDGDRIMEQIMSAWEDGAWMASTKMVYEYRDYESYTMTLSTGSEEAWVQSQRFVTDFDARGNTTLSTVEIFAGDWMMLSGSRYTLTYDGEHLVERVTEAYGMGAPGTKGATFGGSWKNLWKEEFKDFASLSTGTIVIEGESIEHYPNPAGEIVSLKINNLQDRNLSVTIMDLTGKTIHQEKVYIPNDSYIHVVNLDDVPAGTFIIQAREASGKLVSSSRLIHQR